MLLLAASDPPHEPTPQPDERPDEPDVPPVEPGESPAADLAAEPTPATPGVEPSATTPRPPAAPDTAWTNAPALAEPPGPAEPPTPVEPPEPEAPPARLAPAEPTPRSLPQRILIAALLIAAAALIGYALTRPTDGDAAADALARTVEVAGRLTEPFETDDPAAALAYIRGEFGWRVGVPVFPEAQLEGVAIARVAPAVEVPVFLYRAGGERVPVFAYSYALFDQVTDRLRLRRADYDALTGEDAVTRRTRGTDLVLWRDRDDIYVAVTDLPPEQLLDGMRMAR